MKKSIFILILIGVILAGGFVGYNKYRQVFSPNVPLTIEEELINIPSNAGFEDVVDLLNEKGLLIDEDGFRWVAEKMKYQNGSVKAGKYRINPGMSNRALVGLLRSGRQEPVRVTIRAVRSLEMLAGLASRELEFDSSALVEYLLDEWLPGSSYTRDNALSLFIPNTYEFYWNTSPKQFIARMQKEHDRFWSGKRTELAEALGLTPAEVYALASIVERETQDAAEKPRIAGVYLNRLEKGMLLQADPTVIFAQNDFTIKRVLKKHLEIDSPFNTYKYTGLPPGPIYMPTIQTIDATLNAEDHKYIYFCVNPEKPGTHAFASTLNGHLRNARRYQQWANRNGIR